MHMKMQNQRGSKIVEFLKLDWGDPTQGVNVQGKYDLVLFIDVPCDTIR